MNTGLEPADALLERDTVALEQDTLETIVSISADIVFEYSSESRSLKVFMGSDGCFYEEKNISDDFEQIFKENESVYADDLDTFEQICDNIKNGIDRAVFELRFSTGGDYRWYRVKMKAIKNDSDPYKFSVIGKAEDVSDLKSAEMRLIDKAERDPLTHIYNKATTKRLIKNYLRTDTKDSLDAFIIIDVDNFKQINDTFGHLFGDSILVDLSQEMQDLFRSNDVVGRIGGDEFIVFLRGLKNTGHVENKANDICKIFDLLYADEDGTKITGSLGIAMFPQDGDTFDDLYKRADTALYTSKRAGKSCYTFYDKSKDVSELPSLPRVEQYRSGMEFLKHDTDFEAALIRYALDISENSISNETAEALFKKAGKHFMLGRVSVYEADGQGNFTVTRQWCGKRFEPTAGEGFTLSVKELAIHTAHFDKNGIYTGGGNSPFERFLSERGVKSCIASASYTDGVLSGMLVFEECTSPRVWSIEEARAVNMIRRLYFSFFSRIL